MEEIRNIFTIVIGKQEEMRIVGNQKVIKEAKIEKDRKK
jgi:hypothetical protein